MQYLKCSIVSSEALPAAALEGSMPQLEPCWSRRRRFCCESLSVIRPILDMQADTEEGQAACDRLGVEVLPTVQFWRDKKKLWEHRGILHLEQDLGEGKTLPLWLAKSC